MPIQLSGKYDLESAYPNPFRERATVAFTVGEKQSVTVALYDALGRRVRVLHEGVAPAGETQTVSLEARRLSSGLYFVRLSGSDFHATETVTLVR